MSFEFDPDYVRKGSMLGHVAEVELTTAQKKLWDETRSKFVFQCPAFSHILYELMVYNKTGEPRLALFTRDLKMPMPDGKDYYPPAATDGAYLIINPDEFFTFNASERVFIMAHEVLHCVFNHMAMNHLLNTRGKVAYQDGYEIPFIKNLMNVAEDLVINDILIESKVGAMPQRNGEQFGCWDRSLGTANDAPLDVYRKLYDDAKSQGRIKQMKSFDAHLSPGSAEGTPTPGQAIQNRSDTAWKTGVAAAQAIGRAQGDQSAALDRLLGALTEPKVSWQEHIRALFARKVGNGGFDWRRADRRLISRSGDLGDPVFAPGRAGNGCDTVAVAIDTSGSIGERELNVFFTEMASILEDVRPKRLIVLWCDADVNRVDEIEDAGDLNTLREKGAPGGGGTRFEPVFDELVKMGLDKVDALVYLTDGYGSFPHQSPDYPVIWGNIAGNPSRYPWGDVVDIDMKS